MDIDGQMDGHKIQSCDVRLFPLVSWICATYFVVNTFMNVQNMRTSTSIQTKKYTDEVICFAIVAWSQHNLQIVRWQSFDILKQFNVTYQGNFKAIYRLVHFFYDFQFLRRRNKVDQNAIFVSL